MINIFWFRRDLRLTDNIGLYQALSAGLPLQCIFIFDQNIIEGLEPSDPRLTFIYQQLEKINQGLNSVGSSLLVLKGDPLNIFKSIAEKQDLHSVYCNEYFEPYSIQRDEAIKQFLHERSLQFLFFQDHLIHAPNDILKKDGSAYTVYTAYKNSWLASFKQSPIADLNHVKPNYHQKIIPFPSLEDLTLKKSQVQVRDYQLENLNHYHKLRDQPSEDAGSYLGPHLRFGTISIREIIRKLDLGSDGQQSFLNELIWREFFTQILFHFPESVNQNFKSKYNGISWRNNEEEFKAWTAGETGYPMVDAGMKQLNQTGYMHNRIRMICAGFLCKHLLIHWSWGEAYFASKLLDYELASNNGNWQWSAGTGCDAAPYFRIFNPWTQQQKFDPKFKYVKKWITDFNPLSYRSPIVEHQFARKRALEVYKQGINSM